MIDLCQQCEHMRRDNAMRVRCYSPQLKAMNTAGILCVFERDGTDEDGRSHEAGNGKCGRDGINFKRKEAY